MKVNVDNESCEANGVCEAVAPDVFELDEEDTLHIKAEPAEESLDQVRRAVASCPKMALSLDGADPT